MKDGQPGSLEVRFKLRGSPRGAETGAHQEASGAVEMFCGKLARISEVLALAIQFEEMVRSGQVKDYADLARLGGVTRERMSQIMKLVWLAPDITQEVLYLPPALGGRHPISEVALRRIGSVLAWEKQRSLWNQLKTRHNISGVADPELPRLTAAV